MGRAARRAQDRAERRQRQQTRAPQRPQITAPGPPAEAGQRRRSLLRPRWATDILSELSKVTWPTRRETANLTVVVIVVSLLFGAVLGASDVGFSWLIEHTVLR